MRKKFWRINDRFLHYSKCEECNGFPSFPIVQNNQMKSNSWVLLILFIKDYFVCLWIKILKKITWLGLFFLLGRSNRIKVSLKDLLGDFLHSQTQQPASAFFKVGSGGGEGFMCLFWCLTKMWLKPFCFLQYLFSPLWFLWCFWRYLKLFYSFGH